MNKPESKKATAKIIVVDDHPMFREAVARTLGAEPGFAVVAMGGSALEAVQLAALHDPDVMLLDVNMTGGGIAACRTIKVSRPKTRVLMLSMCEDPDLMVLALKSGAVGYLLKGIAGRDLTRTIRMALSRLPPIGVSQARCYLELDAQFGKQGQRAKSIGYRKLTDLELTWLSLAASGAASTEIAGRLDLDETTASSIVSAIHINRCSSALPDSAFEGVYS